MNGLAEKLTIHQFVLLVHSLGALSVCLIIALTTVFVIMPMRVQIESSRQHALQLDGLSEHHETAAAELEQLMQEFEESASLLAVSQSRVSLGSDLDGFLELVGNAARPCGIRIRELRPGTTGERYGYRVHSVQMSLEGPYRGICEFFAALQSLDRMNRVIQASMAPHGNSEDLYAVSLTLELFATMPPEVASLHRPSRVTTLDGMESTDVR
ncbi:type 4a pilus biogenesis protein PilO [Rubinisphaera margarita]|uniref:type 4a pilus biogenesis protein PilO n=1 Tax=Rubinisphaera margarita TaxID=2909586 RepID=UPI001EE90228|nr:type 4a pilus biogenesis protein PilO [Rubinisphaera margarita]MCG6155832.1 type 4a pilus biogenesis protein PilO [Rubinisphaera margarita]